MVKGGKDTSKKECPHVVSLLYPWPLLSWPQNLSACMEPYRLSGSLHGLSQFVVIASAPAADVIGGATIR